MDESFKQSTDYIGYEYKEVVASGPTASLYLDSYPCFGWEPDPNAPPKALAARPGRTSAPPQLKMQFRRNRKISNKAELTRLQRNFDSCAAEIHALEKAKTSSATIQALVVALIGTAFMALSTFCVTAEEPNYPLSFLLAIPGFLGWVLPYFLYRIQVRKKTVQMNQLIEQKYEEIHTICEKWNRLLF